MLTINVQNKLLGNNIDIKLFQTSTTIEDLKQLFRNIQNLDKKNFIEFQNYIDVEDEI